MSSPLAIGLDIGGTQTKGVVVDASGKVVAQSVEPSNPTGSARPDDVVAAVRAHVDHLTKQVGQKIDRIGCAVPGLVDRAGRTVSWLPASKLPLQGVTFADAFNWTRAIPVANDAHAALLGETWTGCAAGERDAILLTLGTGVGGAILSDGKLVRGAIGRGGHLGQVHIGSNTPPSICDMPGSLEGAIGNATVGARSGGKFEDTRSLVEAANAGDADAQRVWHASVHYLAMGIASFINALDPAVVILSGGIAKAGDALLAPLRAELAKVEWKPTGTNVPIVMATLGEWAGAVGAARMALEET